MPCNELRFLVVEDHPVQMRLLVALLYNLRAAAVHQACDGRQALELIRDQSRPVDIIISDLSMPGMDGLELVRNLAAAASPTALIITSAMSPAVLASVADMAVAYQVQLLGAIAKPVSLVKLVPLVKLFREMQARAGCNGASLAEMAAALGRDEFDATFEPKASLKTAEVLGFHARPVWRHPEQGLLDFETFAEAAEAYGLLDSILWAVLRKATNRLREWASQGSSLGLSFSPSCAWLLEPDLVTRLEQLVRASGIEPCRVVLGLSKAVVETDAQVLKAMSRLRAAGFGLAVEHLGSGGMSGGKQSMASFTELKITRNLVSGIRRDETPDAGLIVALDTAQQLRLVAVAEGIETLDEWNLLQSWGCQFGLGGFIGKPLEGDDVFPWLQARGHTAVALGATGKPLDLA